MLASTPSQHLKSDFRPSRNPTNKSTFRNRALVTRRAVRRVTERCANLICLCIVGKDRIAVVCARADHSSPLAVP